jgi:ABC-type molybdate transport system ATPase subunit
MEEVKNVKNEAKRICIYTKDVQILTGKSERSARNIIATLKLIHSKDRHQLVTIKEFCDYTGLEEMEVKRLLM